MSLLPVRSAEPVSKQRLPQLVRQVSGHTIKPPVKSGDVITTVLDGDHEVAILAAADI